MATQRTAVTGVSGYTGKYIARRLLAMGHEVITLTGHPDRPHEFGDQVKAYHFNFDDPEALTETLRGIDTLYITYWIRFSYKENTHERAVANTKVLFDAAKAAGVRRVVYVSITNPTLDSELIYFSGKADLERHLKASGLSHAILRPAVLFGGETGEDILLNNIAWLLRRFPVFAIMGKGDYGLRPIHVEDLADLAVAQGQAPESVTLDAVGPESYPFRDLVKLIKSEIGSRSILVNTPPMMALLLSRIVGAIVGDMVLTRDEVIGLMDDLLLSDQEPTGPTKLSEWLYDNRDLIGTGYASELGRHFKK